MRNKDGFSLVEVMIALLVTLIVALAMMQTVLVSIEANTKNVIRDEAVKIAEGRLNEARNMPFDDLTVLGVGTDNDAIADCPAGFAFPTGLKVTRSVRNISQDFCTNRTGQQVSANPAAVQIEVNVSWDWRGEPARLRFMALRRQ